MTMFTFYLCKADGSAASFEAFDLGSDRLARQRAGAMLAQHPSCAYVNAWRGDRKVWTERRDDASSVLKSVAPPYAHPGGADLC